MNTVVVGVVFLDIKGFPFFKYDAIGTNLGNVLMTQGGVARNVAEDMANLGAGVSFVTMFDENGLGAEARNRLAEAGVNLDSALILPEKGMGMWLAVFDEKNDLAGSISRMPDASPMEALFEEKGEEIIKSARNIVLEMDLSEKISERVMELAKKYNKPVYAIVSNMSVILRRPELMAQTDCVILNEIEAGRLFGMELRRLAPEEMLTRVYAAAKNAGINAIVVTMGSQGSVYIDFRSGDCGHIPCIPCEVADTTGAGDAFFSAAVESLSRGMSLREAVIRGTRLASMTIASPESACPRMDESFFAGA